MNDPFIRILVSVVGCLCMLAVAPWIGYAFVHEIAYICGIGIDQDLLVTAAVMCFLGALFGCLPIMAIAIDPRMKG